MSWVRSRTETDHYHSGLFESNPIHWLPPTRQLQWLARANVHRFQSLARNYSVGSTPFGEIVAPPLPAYNRPTLVAGSPFRFRVEHGKA